MKSFSSFYRSNKDKLFGYLMRLTGNYQLSCDITQESFTRVLTHYGPELQKASLLFTIARNALRDNARKNAYRIAATVDPESEAMDSEQLLLVREEYRRTLAAMQRLEKTEKDILAMVVSSDLTYREIAAIVGISEANVRVKVHRARIRLREFLKAGDES